MAEQTAIPITLELDNIAELFSAPAVNPFSSHEIDITGEAGIDRLIKKAVKPWPLRQMPARIILRLPAEQITPQLTEQTRLAVQRYCASKIAYNRRERQLDFQVSRQELGMAFVIALLAMTVTFLFLNNPLDRLPLILRIILASVAGLTAGIAIYDSIYALVFDWIPYTQEARAYQRISALDITLEPISEPAA